MPGLHLSSRSFYIEHARYMAKKITIIQQPSPLGRLNLRVHIEKHISVLKSVIKNWIINQIKIIAVNIIAFDQYCVSFSPSGSFFPTRSERPSWLKS